jgi:two-component system cell cycle sensor histidine kinase/response regulator CckA
LESIGQLAGGVAHDFNNLLTAILGFAELAQGRLPKDHPVQDDLERIVQASMRAANLVRQLLGFARKQLTQPRPIRVNAVIQELLPLLEHSLGENIRLQFNLTKDENTVFMDPAQLEQVIMNLALNARDAMQSKGGGTLTITTLRRAYTKERLPMLEGEEFPLGEYVYLIVEDTGEGIPPEICERIFEPFFSTKGVGSTGLGLATVYGIVRQNKGFITVESEVGVGTRFTVCLPAWTAQVQSHADDPSRTPPDTGNH